LEYIVAGLAIAAVAVVVVVVAGTADIVAAWLVAVEDSVADRVAAVAVVVAAAVAGTVADWVALAPKAKIDSFAGFGHIAGSVAADTADTVDSVDSLEIVAADLVGFVDWVDSVDSGFAYIADTVENSGIGAAVADHFHSGAEALATNLVDSVEEGHWTISKRNRKYPSPIRM